ncbi:MAG: membrane protease YdiL (CAAX protease family) [Colwellia sp.]
MYLFCYLQEIFKMKSSALAVFLISIIGLYATNAFLAGFIQKFISSTFFSEQLSFLIYAVILSFFVIKFVINKRDDSRTLIKLKGVSCKKIIITLIIGGLTVPIAFGFNSIEVLTVAQFSPELANSLWDFKYADVEFTRNYKLGSNFIVFFTFLVVHSFVGPFVEELTYRGAILPILNQKYSKILALLFTAILFMLLHPPKVYLDTFVFSLLVGWLTLQTGQLIYAFLIHASYNLLSWLLEGYNVIEMFRNKSPLLLATPTTWVIELIIAFFAVILVLYLSSWLVERSSIEKKEYIETFTKSLDA